MPCDHCCHETRNAMAAVVMLARNIQRQAPHLAPAQLPEALARLDQQINRCASRPQVCPREEFEDFD